MKRTEVSNLVQNILDAQKRVTVCRDIFFENERKIRKLREELEDFEKDPDGWSHKHYGPRHDRHSYPTVTRITKSRNRLEKCLSYRAKDAEQLRQAEARLQEAETHKLSSLSPELGAVWPLSLPSMTEAWMAYEQAEDAIDAEALKRAEKSKAEIDQAYENEISEINERLIKQWSELLQEVKSGPAEDREKFIEFWAKHLPKPQKKADLCLKS